MASANASADCSGNVSSSGNDSVAVPQWKRDLIQRRRQQNKVLTSNGASVKLCSAVTGTFANNNVGTVDAGTTFAEPVERSHAACVSQEQNPQQSVGVGGVASCAVAKTRTPDSIGSSSEYSSSSCQQIQSQQQQQLAALTSSVSSRGQTTSGATVVNRGTDENHGYAVGDGEGNVGTLDSSDSSGVSSVVCNMRLETDASSLCPSSDDAPNFNARNNQHQIGAMVSGMERSSLEYENYENEDAMRNYGNNGVNNKQRSSNREHDNEQEARGRASRIIKRMDKESSAGGVCIFAAEQARKSRVDKSADTLIHKDNGKTVGDECESDSSEELQYGPGIVNRLKSKYLNLALREMNKSRVSVQRFRRAASLEDLLDCDDEPNEKSTRKYAKRNSPGVAPKTDRYRNASRGNESMKRARSVETLMRYNTPSVVEEPIQPNRFLAVRIGQEPANDHIVLIDRSSVKIESRLGDPDRPPAINKPKRIKPLLAETERPPPDLVKTTMRIFEGSVKKFKPKGEVAVKVATFKTINDTYKAQALKKVVPKPPIQPKPFVNGNSKTPGSPKKINLPQIPTAELIEKPEVLDEYRNDGVVTDPIAQSVSSVVSKFRQIEKSHSPSPSPEPAYKLKFSPVPSPEPPLSKLKTSNESLAKSPPVTPTPSPRIASPGAPSPASPKRELARQNSSPVHPCSSPSRELFRQPSAPDVPPKSSTRNEERERDAKENAEEYSRREINESNESSTVSIAKEEAQIVVEDERSHSNAGETSNDESEDVDGSRTITKLALENISKAGSTVQFNFGDKSSIGKSYLPGAAAAPAITHNGQKTEATNGLSATKDASPTSENCTSSMPMETTNDDLSRVNERLEPEKTVETKVADRSPSPGAVNSSEYTKPIGAISSLGLIKTSPTTTTTTTTSYPQSNESKTIRSQKTDISPPQKQIGIIRPLVSTKTQIAQQNLSNRELEKNLINRVKSIEQPTKVVVSLKSADEIQPVKKTSGSPGSGGGGLWDTKPWNQANNTMVFNFSNRKDVPDYIENDGLIIRRKREKPKAGDGGVIVLDATLDASTTDDSDWEISGGPPSPCDVSFTNDNIVINGHSNLSRQPRNHKFRIQFDDGATRTFEYPSEASLLEDEGTSVDGDTSSVGQQSSQGANKSSSASSAATMSSALLGGGGLASFTPSKMDLASEGFELGVTRTTTPAVAPAPVSEQQESEESANAEQDAAAWGAEATADLLY